MAEEEMKELKKTEGEDDAQKDDEVKEEEEGEGQVKEDEDKPGEEMQKMKIIRRRDASAVKALRHTLGLKS